MAAKTKKPRGKKLTAAKKVEATRTLTQIYMK